MSLYGETDLVLTRDEPYTRKLRYAIDTVDIDWTGWTFKLELRSREGYLLGDLTPYLAIDTVPQDLVLTLPGTVTAFLPSEARWDILGFAPGEEADGLRFPKPPGRLLVRQGVTQRG